MPMKQEQSSFLEAISGNTPPIHQDSKPPVDSFQNDELLYRRYLSEHFNGGQILPASFRFPRKSFNRSRFSKPEDLPHPDCFGGKALSPHGALGVVEGPGRRIPRPGRSP